MHFLPDLHFLNWLFWMPVLGFWSNSGGNKATSNTETNTTSGQNSPAASGGSQAVGSGSIGVSGTGAKYLEQGAADLSGAQIGGVSGSNVNASGGATINIGDPQAVQTIAALAQNFADTVQTVGSGGGGSTVVTSGPGSSGSPALPSNWLGWAIIILGGLGILYLLKGKKS